MTAHAQQADTQPGLLDGAEISNLLRTMQAAQFKQSEDIRPKDTSFKPRSLVEIAQEAEQKRKEEQAKRDAEEAARHQAELEARRQAEAEQAALAEQMQAEQMQAEQIADEMQAEPQMPAPDAELPDNASLSADAAQPHTDNAASQPAQPVPTITEEELELRLKEAEAALRASFDAEKKALEESLTETHYHRGFEAGMTAAQTAEPSEEEKAHIAHQEAERADIVSRFHAIIASAAQMDAVDSRALAEEMEMALLRLAGERAGLAITENPAGMVHKIRQMADNIASTARVMDVYLQDEDKRAIETWLSDAEHNSEWRLHADSAMSRGDIRIVIGGIELCDMLSAPVQPDSAAASEEDTLELTAPAPEQAAPEQPEPEQASQTDKAAGAETQPPQTDMPEPDMPETETEAEAGAETETQTPDTPLTQEMDGDDAEQGEQE